MRAIPGEPLMLGDVRAAHARAGDVRAAYARASPISGLDTDFPAPHELLG